VVEKRNWRGGSAFNGILHFKKALAETEGSYITATLKRKKGEAVKKKKRKGGGEGKIY